MTKDKDKPAKPDKVKPPKGTDPPPLEVPIGGEIQVKERELRRLPKGDYQVVNEWLEIKVTGQKVIYEDMLTLKRLT